MKTYLKNRLDTTSLVGWIAMVLLVFAMSQPAKATLNVRGVSFQVFYDGLAPHGDWVQDPTYGYIWIPYVEAGFQPYRTNGYWVNSHFGNTWVSYYDWGWAPFHYGRWFFSDFYGWAWVPGYEWGPAWVEWRTGGGYYGWAPLVPSFGVHVSVGLPVNCWVFVPRRRFLARNIHQYYIAPRNVTVIYNQTTIINNTYVYNDRTYVAGPSRTELQRVTRNTVPVYEVAEGTRPGRATVANNQVTMYRPDVSVSSSRGNSADVRPSRAYSSTEYQEMRRSSSSNRVATGESRASRQQAATATVPTTANTRSATVNSRANTSHEAVATSPRRNAVGSSEPVTSAQPTRRGQSIERQPMVEPTRREPVAPERSGAPIQRNSAMDRSAANESRGVQSPARTEATIRPNNPVRSSSGAQTMQPSQRMTRNEPQVRPSAPSRGSVERSTRQDSQPRYNNGPRTAPAQNRVAPSSRITQRSEVGTYSQAPRQSQVPRVSSSSSSRSSSAQTSTGTSRNAAVGSRRGN